jgi:hypothetical protein
MLQNKQKQAKEWESYVDQIGTNIVHPFALAFFALASIWTFLAPRRYVIWALLFIACFISPAQRFAFLSIDFHFARALAFLILFRILLLGDLRGVQLRTIDYLIFSGACVIVLCNGLRQGGVDLLPELGRVMDGVAIYLIGRAYVRSCDDLRSVLLGAAIAAVPVMIGFVIEKTTSRNYFSIFGGVPEITVIRDGKLRAQGAFTHPIIAGVFWAAFTPLFLAVLLAKGRKLFDAFVGWVGTISSILILFMTASSTPIAGLLIGIVGWCTFPYRVHLRAIRWTILVVAVFLHLISERGLHAVVFTKINFISASTGYHRFMLIEGSHGKQEGFLQPELRGYHERLCAYRTERGSCRSHPQDRGHRCSVHRDWKSDEGRKEPDGSASALRVGRESPHGHHQHDCSLDVPPRGVVLLHDDRNGCIPRRSVLAQQTESRHSAGDITTRLNRAESTPSAGSKPKGR